MAKQFVKEKRIVVKSFGPILILGGVMGPVLKPLIKDTKTIMALINTGHDVYEVFDDGTELKLNAKNYETDNRPSKKVTKPEQHDGAPKENEKSAESSDNKQPEDKKESGTTPIEMSDNKTFYADNNKNKKKNK